jgi:energy-coupling factor transporter ATP-binding protein EcfA2
MLGVFLLIVGPSGSGKSTVMKLLLESRKDFTHSLRYYYFCFFFFSLNLVQYHLIVTLHVLLVVKKRMALITISSRSKILRRRLPKMSGLNTQMCMEITTTEHRV